MTLITPGSGAHLIGGVAHGAVLRGGQVIWRRHAAQGVSPTLDPATAEIMMMPWSNQANFYEPWRGGGGGGTLDILNHFRPQYAGSGGTRSLPGYWISSLVAPIGYDGMISRLIAEHTFDAGAHPVNDLAGKDALILSFGDNGFESYLERGLMGAPYNFQDWDSRQRFEDNLATALTMVAAAAAAGVTGILIYGQAPQMPGTAYDTDDTPWRPAIAKYERTHHVMCQRIREWLSANGHTDMWCNIMPVHRLAAKLYDDSLAGLVPGGVTTHRQFRSGWGEETQNHVYMWNDVGLWAQAYMLSLALYGEVPSGDLTNTYVAAPMAAYLSGVVEDIMATYAYAGRGGTDWGEPGAIDYNGETLAEIMPGAEAHWIEYATSTIFSDRAGSVPAVATDPVGRIVTADGLTFTADSDVARPIMDDDGTVDFANSPLRGEMPTAIAPRYIATVVNLHHDLDEHDILSVGGYRVEHKFDGGRIGLDITGGFVAPSVNGWGDLPVMVEMFYDDANGRAFVVVTNLAWVSDTIPKISTAGPEPRIAPTSGTALVLGGNTNRWGANDNFSDAYLYVVSDQVPTIDQQVLIRRLIATQTGLSVWEE